MSTLGLTKNRQVDLGTYGENIRRGASRTIAALLGRQSTNPVVHYQGETLGHGNVTFDELKNLYRMVGGFDSVNQQVVWQLDRISRRGHTAGEPL